jgi:hypothetical protein
MTLNRLIDDEGASLANIWGYLYAKALSPCGEHCGGQCGQGEVTDSNMVEVEIKEVRKIPISQGHVATVRSLAFTLNEKKRPRRLVVVSLNQLY